MCGVQRCHSNQSRIIHILHKLVTNLHYLAKYFLTIKTFWKFNQKFDYKLANMRKSSATEYTIRSFDIRGINGRKVAIAKAKAFNFWARRNV